MAHAAQEEQLLDIRVAEASAAYKFYLNQERKILGTIAVIGFLLTLGNHRQLGWSHQPHVYERAIIDCEGGLADVRVGRNLE